MCLSNGHIYFRGAGIFCRGCKDLTTTKELLILANEGKVLGEVNHLTLNVKDIFKGTGLEQIYRTYNIHS